MKDELKFTVTLKGRWYENNQRATPAQVARELREALNAHFQYMLDGVTVTRAPSEPTE